MDLLNAGPALRATIPAGIQWPVNLKRTEVMSEAYLFMAFSSVLVYSLPESCLLPLISLLLASELLFTFLNKPTSSKVFFLPSNNPIR